MAAALLSAGGCSQGENPAARDSQGTGDVAAAVSLAVDARADSAPGMRLEVDPPPARIWLERVSPSRPGSLDPPLPGAEPDRVPESPPPALDIDEDLKPPILKNPALLVLPAVRVRSAYVELEVHVDAQGRVSDAVWVGGVQDTALVRAARACAQRMAFIPAERAGVPVAVWCRQRFEFGD